MSLFFRHRARAALFLGAGLGLFAAARAAQAESEARHCGTRSHTLGQSLAVQAQGGLQDCSAALTRPDPSYADGGLYELKVVFHVIESADGSLGAISDEQIREQLQVVNDAFQARSGSGPATGVSFALATVDPSGAASSGITRQRDAQWFADSGDYFEVLAWDPERYINVYSNQAGGLLGYSFLPADMDSEPGTPRDRVVLAFDRVGLTDDPESQGHTLTHELGHYLGLDHTFAPNPTTPETFICPPTEAPACYETGDLICDTPSEDAPSEECLARISCGAPAAIENYMNYSPDGCLDRFTAEQVLRMRCTVLAFRPGALWPAARLATSEHPRQPNLASYTLRLNNDSAETQRFTVELASADFTVHFADGSNSVETDALTAGAVLDLEFEVELPANADPDDVGSVELRAGSDLNAQIATLPLSVLAFPASELRLEALNDRALGTPQTPAAFRVRLTNPGVIDDVYELALDSAWEATFATNNDSTLNLPLAAQTSADIDLVVQVPADARAHEFGAVTLSAESSVTPAARASLLLTAEADAYSRALLERVPPLPSIAPGTTQEVVVLLRNAGNVAASYALTLSSRGPLQATLHADTVGPLAPFAEQGSSLRVSVQAEAEATATVDAGVTLVASAVSATEDNASLDLPLSVTASGRVEVTPRAVQRELPAGEAVTLTFSVENRSLHADRYELRVETASLLLEAPQPALDVAATGSEPFRLRLEKRTDGTELTRVRVSSLNDPSRSQSAEIVLRAASDTDAGIGTEAGADAGATNPAATESDAARPATCSSEATCPDAGALPRRGGDADCQCRLRSDGARRHGTASAFLLALVVALCCFRLKSRP